MSLLDLWTREIDESYKKLRKEWDESYWGGKPLPERWYVGVDRAYEGVDRTCYVYLRNDQVIAECTNAESLEAARRLIES